MLLPSLYSQAGWFWSLLLFSLGGRGKETEANGLSLRMRTKEGIILFWSGLLVALLYSEVVRWLFSAWLYNPYYSHGLLLLLVGPMLIYLKRGEIYHQEPANWHILPLGVGFFLYLLGILWHYPMLLAFSLLLVLAGLALVFLGEGAKPVLFPIFLFATAIPLPFLDSVAIPLQYLSASSVSAMFRFLGMGVSMTGNNVSLAGNTYWIAPACSGLNRLMPLLGLTAIIAYLLHGSPLARIGLLALVIPLALASNIFRLFVTVLIGDWYGIEAALGFFHTVSSLLFFFFALALIFAFTRIFKLRMPVPASV
ncbi:MAG: exosortase/archaeosortase family protein [Methanophagales archaeon ANME-1-THS]|nr:MAG: exosortase/archaeosortase family protein [Methanophagales archaeon ANME-1-THS]